MATATKATKATKTASPKMTVPTLPNPFEAFSANPASFDVPIAMREFAEKGITQARDTYAKMKSAAEDTTDVVEDTYETARDGAFALGAKTLDTARANTDATFAFAKDLFGAKTMAEIIELQTAFARQQFETATAQFKDFQEFAQKLFVETSKPMTAHVEKTFKDFRAD
ncbi:phasin [Bauldia sp.]|uniref:phasin n=1 Tax=Bauldia sp. TaxID=2575872 RepID=UPI003BA91F79